MAKSIMMDMSMLAEAQVNQSREHHKQSKEQKLAVFHFQLNRDREAKMNIGVKM